MTMPLDLASQPVTNWALNPRCTSLTSTSNIGNTAGTSSVDTTRWFSAEDASSVKLVGGSGRCWLVEEAAVRAGTWRWSFWAYAEAACTFNAYWEMSNPYTGGLGGGTVSVPAGVWTRVTGTATITGEQVAAGTGTRNLRFGWLGGSSTVATTVWTDDVVITCEQPLPEPPVRGATPGWAWRGTADASASVGWPYTLESIGGPPLAVLTGPNQTVPLTLTQLPATASRSIYVALQRNAIVPGGSPSYWFVDGTAGSAETVVLRQDAGGHVAFRPQFTGGGGAGAAYSTVVSGPQVGAKAVIAVTQPEGLASLAMEINGGNTAGLLGSGAANSRTGMDVGSGITTPRFASTSDSTYDTVLVAYLFPREHDVVTRRRVTAWLARRYGAPIPAGY